MSTSQNYLITNYTGANLYCVESSNSSLLNEWLGTDPVYFSGVVGDYWVYNFYQNYGTTTDNNYYGTVTFCIAETSQGYPYFAQTTKQSLLYDLGVNSYGDVVENIFKFNWQNFINFDPYTSANFGANSSAYSDPSAAVPNLFSNNCGLVGLNADWTYFPVGSGSTYYLLLPYGFYWGPAGDYTYFLTNNLNDSDEQYVWFAEEPARGNYTILEESGQQVISQLAPYQVNSDGDGMVWSRAYTALTQNCSGVPTIDSAETAASYGVGATYGTWSIDFCSGDSQHLVCESFYLTQRPFLSPETTANYGDGQPPTDYLEVDGIETLWQNNAAGYPQDTCVQGGAFCGGVYTGGFPVPLDQDYVGVWIRTTMQVIAASGEDDANIIFTYSIVNADGTTTPITLSNGSTEWNLSIQDPSFCTTLTNYLAENEVLLYLYISTWSDSTLPVGYSVTTQYANYTYTPP